MGIFAIPLVFLGAWLYDRYQNKKGNIAYRKHHEQLRRDGLEK
jgi:hypothetical protein